MQKTETLEIEAFLHAVSEKEQPPLSLEEFLAADEDNELSPFTIPREYQAVISSFESPLMEYIRNIQVKAPFIPSELSFIRNIYDLTRGRIIKIIDDEEGESAQQELFRLLRPLARKTRLQVHAERPRSINRHVVEREVQQILNRCYLVLFSNFSQMQSAIIQGIIYDIERQGVHLPIQSSSELATIAQQYRPIVQNQAVIIRNMFRHLFPSYVPPDNIHILELCFLGLLEHIQHNLHTFLQHDEQLLQMLSRIKMAQDELLNVKDPQLANILVKMERIQNKIHDIYNQRWRDGILNDIISTFFYHARFIAYLENKGKIAKKRRYFLVSLEHLLNNYEEFYEETLAPQVELLMAEYKKVDSEGYPFVNKHIKLGKMKQIFQAILDEDRFSVLSEMIFTGDFSKSTNEESVLKYAEELLAMHKELRQKHAENEILISYINQMWEILDNLQELIISEIFNKWKGALTTIFHTYAQELLWFHACFSTYTLEAFPDKEALFEHLNEFIKLYQTALNIFSENILRNLESLSQQVYAFRDRAGDFNLLYTGILGVDLRQEEKHFQFELYTPKIIKEVGQRLSELGERYQRLLQPENQLFGQIAFSSEEARKNHIVHTDEIEKTATYLVDEKDLLIYVGSRKLFTGPHFEPEDFALLYEEVLEVYDKTINRIQRDKSDPLDSIVELKSLRERAQFELVYERYTEVVKYKALRKAWELIRKRGL